MDLVLRRIGLFFVPALCLAFVLAMDAWFADEPFLAESDPRSDGYFLLRGALALVLALLVTREIYRSGRFDPMLRPARRRSPAGLAAAWASVILAPLSVILLARSPELYNALAVEDSAIEWSSALLLLAGSALLLGAAARLIARPRGGRAGFVPALLFAAALLLIGMEEVSWFQRLSGVATPEWLGAINAQKETNLHNIATSVTENTYYLGAFLFLVLLPFVADAGGRSRFVARVAAFVPSRFVVVVGAVATALGYQMWNIVWFQFAVFASLVILITYAASAFAGKRSSEGWLFLVSALVMACTQVAMMALGPTMVRSFEDTEYREFFIALGLFVAALEAAGRLRGSLAQTLNLNRSTSPSLTT